jgi:DNA (cytosine-5)-methyltransferase 1
MSGGRVKVASIFCGAGGLDYGFVKHTDGLFDVVWAVDLFKAAARTYEAYYGHAVDCNDITKVADEDVPVFDVLTGGFPCQVSLKSPL